MESREVPVVLRMRRFRRRQRFQRMAMVLNHKMRRFQRVLERVLLCDSASLWWGVVPTNQGSKRQHHLHLHPAK
eukprot:3071398-Lingulodinium_polyedra.AAC.1